MAQAKSLMALDPQEVTSYYVSLWLITWSTAVWENSQSFFRTPHSANSIVLARLDAKDVRFNPLWLVLKERRGLRFNVRKTKFKNIGPFVLAYSTYFQNPKLLVKVLDFWIWNFESLSGVSDRNSVYLWRTTTNQIPAWLTRRSGNTEKGVGLWRHLFEAQSDQGFGPGH